METVAMLRDRYQTLHSSFYYEDRDFFDPTKIPDVYDCIRYDVIHNLEFLENSVEQRSSSLMRDLFAAIKHVADFVIPQE